MNASSLRRRPILLLALFLAGCSRYHSPTIDVLGSYFPAWMVCILCGLALTLIARLLCAGAGIRLYPAPVVYPCLMAFFTFAVWLIFFEN